MQTFILDINTQNTKYRIPNTNTKYKISELKSWGSIMQNIKLVCANFDIGHQYSKYEIQNTIYKYQIQNISVEILRKYYAKYKAGRCKLWYWTSILKILNSEYKILNKSELKSWENIMQNIKLVGANFDIGHQYSRPASHTFFQYYILQLINPIIFTCTS